MLARSQNSGERCRRLSSMDRTVRLGTAFSDPAIAAHGGELEVAAMRCFGTFATLVVNCQQAGQLPAVSAAQLAGLIYASVHGLVDLQAGGRMKSGKGFEGVTQSVDVLLAVLSSAGRLS